MGNKVEDHTIVLTVRVNLEVETVAHMVKIKVVVMDKVVKIVAMTKVGIKDMANKVQGDMGKVAMVNKHRLAHMDKQQRLHLLIARVRVKLDIHSKVHTV